MEVLTKSPVQSLGQFTAKSSDLGETKKINKVNIVDKREILSKMVETANVDDLASEGTGFLRSKLNSNASNIANFILIAEDDKYASNGFYDTQILKDEINTFMKTANHIKDIYLKGFHNSESSDAKKNLRFLDELNQIFSQATSILNTHNIPDEISSLDNLNKVLDYLDVDNTSIDKTFTESQLKYLNPIKQLLKDFSELRSEIDAVEFDYVLNNNKTRLEV